MPEALASRTFALARHRLAAALGLIPFATLKSLAGSTARFCARRISHRPASTVAGAAFAALLTGVTLNALFLQRSRHPAPMFVAPADAPPAASAASRQPATPAAATLPPVVEETSSEQTGSISKALSDREQDLPLARSPRARGNAARKIDEDGETAPVHRTKPAGNRSAKALTKSGKKVGSDRIGKFLSDGKPHKLHAKRAEE